MLNVIDEFTRECIAIRINRKLKAVDVRPLRGCLLPARSGRKSHQVLEVESGGQPNLMYKATANQFRLFLHGGAYWLIWGLRVSMHGRSTWRVAQFDTLRLRLIKIAARIVEMKTMIQVHLPTSCPVEDHPAAFRSKRCIMQARRFLRLPCLASPG
jgi:Transposase DDE domain group 1